MINVGNTPVQNIMVGNQQVFQVWKDGQFIWSHNLLSTNFADWTQGDWIGGVASIGQVVQPSPIPGTGAAQWRLRTVEPIPVPPNSRLRLRTNFHGIFIVRVLGQFNAVFRDIGQAVGSQDWLEITTSSTEIALAISLSNLPQVENSAGGSNAVWANRFTSGEVYPELEVIG